MDEPWGMHAMMAAVMTCPSQLRGPEVLPQTPGDQRILSRLLGLAETPATGRRPRPEIVGRAHHTHDEPQGYPIPLATKNIHPFPSGEQCRA
jgi:hypothetical protein